MAPSSQYPRYIQFLYNLNDGADVGDITADGGRADSKDAEQRPIADRLGRMFSMWRMEGDLNQ